MKKIVALILIACSLLTLFACNGMTDDSTNNIKHTGKKISGKLTEASVFSDGLAFVCIDGKSNITYCINKEGYIVFELNKDLGGVSGEIFKYFKNGYALIDGGVCNTKGEITYPEDVGVTKFYDIAFEGGYIVAEKVTASYSSTKKELGIMNMKFEWVLEPSEKLYEDLSENLWTCESINTKSCYSNEFVYFDGCQKYLEIATGNIYRSMPASFKAGSYSVNLNMYDNAVKATQYIDGKAAVLFYNDNAKKYFFTLVDKNGNFLFDPVEIKDYVYSSVSIDMEFDGEHFVITNVHDGAHINILSYNSVGELIGELNTESYPYAGYGWDLKDGVIVLRGAYNTAGTCYYLNPDLTPLFE